MEQYYSISSYLPKPHRLKHIGKLILMKGHNLSQSLIIPMDMLSHFAPCLLLGSYFQAYIVIGKRYVF